MPTANHATDEPIEATFTESPPDPPAEPQPCPGTDPLSRADVLRFAHTLAAQVVGLGAAVEGAALTAGRVRPEFTRAWRVWCGSFMADVARLERSLFVAQDEARLCAGYAGRLAEWRRAIAAELGAGGVRVGAVQENANAAHPAKAFWSAPAKWPIWIWAPVGLGACVSAFLSVRWVFRRCMSSLQDAGDREQSGEGEGQ